VPAPPDSIESQIARIFSESVAAKLRFAEEHQATLVRVIDLIASAIRSGKKVLLFGNGGSAADAQHIAAEFTNRMLMERPPLPAIALTTDTSALTSIANDYGFTDVFAKQVAALGQPGDVAIAISTSGNSRNVLAALRVCREKKIHTVGLTGRDGGEMARQVDHLLNVSASTKTPRIQETHILIGHVIGELVDELLFARGEPRTQPRSRPVAASKARRRASARRPARGTRRGRR
jgi:D-sedoheptulose 7-phosphate isomerase